MVWTLCSDYHLLSQKIASPLAREPQQKCCGFFLYLQNQNNPGIWVRQMLQRSGSCLKVQRIAKLYHSSILRFSAFHPPIQAPEALREAAPRFVQSRKGSQTLCDSINFCNSQITLPPNPFIISEKMGLSRILFYFIYFIRVDSWE